MSVLDDCATARKVRTFPFILYVEQGSR